MKRLERYVVKGTSRLRMGYTTGSCAAAAAGAAVTALLTGEWPAVVRLKVPAGMTLELELEQFSFRGGIARCGVRKDAGDDPDVTDGILILAEAIRTGSGIAVLGGEGVGRVTREGLSCPAGGPAINPVPLSMICGAAEEACRKAGYTGGVEITISVPEGREIAAGTFNGRLGIEGGISILGTSGLVEPMSESALVSSIRTELDTRRGEPVLLLTPGNYGRDFVRNRYGLEQEQGVKCSNYIGETLDYAVYSGFRNLLLMGHAGKLIKLAAGIMNTHSSVADGRMEILACHGGLEGLSREQMGRIYRCITVDEADRLLREWNCAGPVWRSIRERLAFQLDYRLKGRAEIAFAVFTGAGVVMESENLNEMLARAGATGMETEH